jgi:putative Holliday junction resolvase
MSPEGSRTVLGFDYGTKSIGVAIGQEITGSASALKALRAADGIPDWDEIGKLLKQWQPDLVVVGLPLNMDGTEQEITVRAKKFARRIEGRFGCRVGMQDERLTTVSAREHLFDSGGYRALKKGSIDSYSAVLILEDFFDSGGVSNNS